MGIIAGSFVVALSLCSPSWLASKACKDLFLWRGYFDLSLRFEVLDGFTSQVHAYDLPPSSGETL
jgi:hypothetical protein